MFYNIKNAKEFYIRKINNCLFYGFGFTLLYYNPYLFLNSIIFILLFNNINFDLKINNESSLKIPYFDINCVIKEKKVDEEVKEEVKEEVDEEVKEKVKEKVKEDVDEEVVDEDDYEEDVMGNKYKRQDRYFTKI